jgi:hypothetical protein
MPNPHGERSQTLDGVVVVKTWPIVATVLAAGTLLYFQNRRDRAEIESLSRALVALKEERRPEQQPRAVASGARNAAEAIEAFERAFQEQKVDHAWTDSVEPAVTSGIRKALENPAEPRTFECREWLCRFEVALAEEDKFDSISQRLNFARFWLGPSAYFRVTGASGELAVRAYLLRDGHPPPPKLTP